MAEVNVRRGSPGLTPSGPPYRHRHLRIGCRSTAHVWILFPGGGTPVAAAALALEDGTIEVAPIAFMRGRTLNNAFVVIDEAQNCLYRFSYALPAQTLLSMQSNRHAG